MYFESHENDISTGLAQPNDKAVLLTFKCAASLHEYLKKKRYEHVGFENRNVNIDPCVFNPISYSSSSYPIVSVDRSHGNDYMLNLPQGLSPIEEINLITGESPINKEFLNSIRTLTSTRLNEKFPNKKRPPVSNESENKFANDSGDSHELPPCTSELQRCFCTTGNTSMCTSITAGSISQNNKNIHINAENYATGNSCYCNSLSFLFVSEFGEVFQTEHINFILKIGFQAYAVLVTYYTRKGGMLRCSELDVFQLRQNKRKYYKK